MPELPEVETVARQLAPSLIGRRISAFRIFDSRLRDGPVPAVVGREVTDVTRSGKRILIALSPRNGQGSRLWLAVHLRMTGRLLWRVLPTADPRPHHRARFTLEGGELLFSDTRRFGTFFWCSRPEDAEPQGVDPLAPDLTGERLAELMRGSPQPLKTWLLRQDRLVGLGNIYASEILHRARLSPFRAAGRLSGGEVLRLHASIRHILERAIRYCGTTFSDFQDASGDEGSFQKFLAVYDRAGKPCRRCRATIARSVQGQRSTYYCPICQRPWQRRLAKPS